VLGKQGSVKIPEYVLKEVYSQKDDLAAWAADHSGVFHCGVGECIRSVPEVLAAYGEPLLNEADIETLWADPYLIAHALAVGGTVVTNEIPSNATAPKNKKIPVVCKTLNVPCLTLPAFMWELRQTMR